VSIPERFGHAKHFRAQVYFTRSASNRNRDKIRERVGKASLDSHMASESAITKCDEPVKDAVGSFVFQGGSGRLLRWDFKITPVREE